MYDHSERSTDTIERILISARDVFAEAGFSGARVDEIARRAGVNKATLYYHIGDKKALYAEVIHGIIGGLALDLAEKITDDLSHEEKIRTYVRTISGIMDRNPQLPRIMMREIASGGKNLPDIFYQDFVSVLTTLTRIIESGMKDGVFIDTIPLIVHFMTLGPNIMYKAVVPIILQNRNIPEALKTLEQDISGRIADEIEKLILRAIRKDRPVERKKGGGK
jgi:TetR/AcrR family transcriptional regulator